MSYFKLSFALTFIILETRYNEIKKHRYTNNHLFIYLLDTLSESVVLFFLFFFEKEQHFSPLLSIKVCRGREVGITLGDWTGRPEINYLQPFRLNRWNSREGSRFNSKRNARGSLSIFVHWERQAGRRTAGRSSSFEQRPFRGCCISLGREQVCIFCPSYFSYYFHNEFSPVLSFDFDLCFGNVAAYYVFVYFYFIYFSRVSAGFILVSRRNFLHNPI